MKYSPTNPVPPEIRAKVAQMLPLSSREDVAAALGMHPATVIRIARKMGVPIRPRGQPYLGVPTVWNAHKLTWPFRPRGRAPVAWAT